MNLMGLGPWQSLAVLVVVAAAIYWYMYQKRPLVYVLFSPACDACETFVKDVMPQMQMRLRIELINVFDTRKLVELGINPNGDDGDKRVPSLFVERASGGFSRYEGNLKDTDAVYAFVRKITMNKV